MRWPIGASEADPEVTSALVNLDRLARELPELAGSAHVLFRALSTVFREAETSAPAPDVMRVVECARSGVPFFTASPPVFDARALRRTARALGRALKDDVPSAAAFSQVDVPAWADAWVRGDMAELGACADRSGLDPVEALSLLRLVVWPALTARTTALDAARTEGVWPGGRCPDCGGRSPMLVESRGLEGSRHARCGTCAGEWTVPRLGCPVCGEADPRRLRSIFVEGEATRRSIAACETCRARVAVVATLARLSAPALLVAELEGLPLLWAVLAEEGGTDTEATTSL
jgi:hypothetical protein